jgi:predicted nucleic acid-binding protein
MPFDKPSLVITDASCLIVLDNINYLDLLPQLFDIVITTPEIVEEYGKTIPKWLKVIEVKNNLLQNELKLLVDPGEASAIALAKEVEIDYLVTDDLQARKLAAKLGLTIIGTLGILLKAKQTGLITLLKPVLEQIEKTNFRTTTLLIDTILRDAGE